MDLLSLKKNYYSIYFTPVALIDLKVQKKLFVKTPFGFHELSCRFGVEETFLLFFFFFLLHKLIVRSVWIKQNKRYISPVGRAAVHLHRKRVNVSRSA